MDARASKQDANTADVVSVAYNKKKKYIGNVTQFKLLADLRLGTFLLMHLIINLKHIQFHSIMILKAVPLEHGQNPFTNVFNHEQVFLKLFLTP